VKKSAATIIEKYWDRLTLDFHSNKRVVDEVAVVPSKRMRNKIAGYITVSVLLLAYTYMYAQRA
jgi:small subunit ribosomal protein S17e